MQSPPKLIIFDLGNVIVPYDDGLLISRMAKQCSDPHAQEKIPYFFKRDWVALQTGKMRDEEIHEKFVGQLGFRGDFDSFKQLWCSHTSHDLEMERLVTELSDKYRVVILSNSTDTHWRHFTTNYDLIRKMNEEGRGYASHLIGEVKPNAACYKYVLDQESDLAGYKITPEMALFTDDGPSLVDGAKAIGIDAVVFTGVDQLYSDLKVRGVRSDLIDQSPFWAGARQIVQRPIQATPKS